MLEHVFFDHSADLERNNHYSVELQSHYNEMKDKGLDPHEYITIDVIYEKSLWLQPSDKEMVVILSDLRKKEKDLINQLRSEEKQLYNKVDRVFTNVKRPMVFKDPVTFKEQNFDSVTDCSIHLTKYFKTLTVDQINQYHDKDVYTSRSFITKRCEASNNDIFRFT